MVLSQIYVWGVFPVKNTLGCLSGRDEYIIDHFSKI